MITYLCRLRRQSLVRLIRKLLRSARKKSAYKKLIPLPSSTSLPRPRTLILRKYRYRLTFLFFIVESRFGSMVVFQLFFFLFRRLLSRSPHLLSQSPHLSRSPHLLSRSRRLSPSRCLRSQARLDPVLTRKVIFPRVFLTSTPKRTLP